MNREEQIKDTAERFYLNNEQNNYEDERLYQAFIRGAKWADANPHWISVKDNLPDDGENVLVFTGKKMAISSIYTFNDVKHWKGSSSFGDSITHWMKLPEQLKNVGYDPGVESGSESIFTFRGKSYKICDNSNGNECCMLGNMYQCWLGCNGGHCPLDCRKQHLEMV